MLYDYIVTHTWCFHALNSHYQHLFSVLVAVVQEAYPLSFFTAVKKKKKCQIYHLKVPVSCVSVAGSV